MAVVVPFVLFVMRTRRSGGAACEQGTEVRGDVRLRWRGEGGGDEGEKVGSSIACW